MIIIIIFIIIYVIIIIIVMIMMMMIIIIIDYFLTESDEEVAQMSKMFPYAPSRPLRFVGYPSPSRRRSSSLTHSEIVRNIDLKKTDGCYLQSIQANICVCILNFQDQSPI